MVAHQPKTQKDTDSHGLVEKSRSKLRRVKFKCLQRQEFFGLLRSEERAKGEWRLMFKISKRDELPEVFCFPDAVVCVKMTPRKGQKECAHVRSERPNSGRLIFNAAIYARAAYGLIVTFSRKVRRDSERSEDWRLQLQTTAAHHGSKC